MSTLSCLCRKGRYSNLCGAFLLAVVLVLICNLVILDKGIKSQRELDGQENFVGHTKTGSVIDPTSFKLSVNESAGVGTAEKGNTSEFKGNSTQTLNGNFTQSATGVEKMFFKVDLSKERKYAVEGGPFHYLPSYENPCWKSRYPPQGNLYKNSWLRELKHVERVTEFLAEMRATQPEYRIRCLPGIFLIGAPGSGTTDLYTMLTKYSNGRILAGSVKEPVYWSHGRESRSFSDYLDLFDPVGDELSKRPLINGTHRGLTIDSSTFNIFRNDLWRSDPLNQGLAEPKHTLAHTLKALYPSAKILVTLRQPSLRLLSQYRANHGTRRSVQQFDWDVREVVSKWEGCIAQFGLRACSYDYYGPLRKLELKTLVVPRASLYNAFVRDWMEVFGEGQMKIFRAEDYYHDRAAVLGDIFAFLGFEKNAMSLPDLSKETIKHKHKAASMLPTTKQFLDNFFRPCNKLLADYLNSSKYLWDGT